MSAIRLQDAIGEIQDCYIAQAHPEYSPAHRRARKWMTVLVAAVIIVLGLMACAPMLFSSLAGDDLSFQSSYKGNGIVEIHIENKSDKVLHFQKKLKLERWSEGQEIPAHGDVIFSGTRIPAQSSGTLTIDLSKAYDLEELEKPLHNDSYYLILTNNNFVFGQDWICTVKFAETGGDEVAYPEPVSPADADPELTLQIETDLQDFFGETLLESDKRAEVIGEYYEACAELIQNSGKTSFTRYPRLRISCTMIHPKELSLTRICRRMYSISSLESTNPRWTAISFQWAHPGKILPRCLRL